MWCALSVSHNMAANQSVGGSTEVVIYTDDDEEFHVPLHLLNKIDLLRAQFAGKGKTQAKIVVPVDCLLFEKVLRFLDQESSSEEQHEIDVWNLEEWGKAASVLGIEAIKDFLATQSKRFDSPVRQISWTEFCQHQKRGDMWVLIGNGIYDISRWIAPTSSSGAIPHPGGTLPLHYRKSDSTYAFEIYHATDECYKLLKTFFVGVLKESDRNKVPPPKEKPSNEFLARLKSFTLWMNETA